MTTGRINQVTNISNQIGFNMYNQFQRVAGVNSR